jgi:DoxX-like family
MSATQMNAAPRWRQIGLWVVKALLAAAFLGAGGAKLYGVPMMVQIFEQIGLGQWFRYLTGSLEVLGGIAVVLPAHRRSRRGAARGHHDRRNIHPSARAARLADPRDRAARAQCNGCWGTSRPDRGICQERFRSTCLKSRPAAANP